MANAEVPRRVSGSHGALQSPSQMQASSVQLQRAVFGCSVAVPDVPGALYVRQRTQKMSFHGPGTSGSTIRSQLPPHVQSGCIHLHGDVGSSSPRWIVLAPLATVSWNSRIEQNCLDVISRSNASWNAVMRRASSSGSLVLF